MLLLTVMLSGCATGGRASKGKLFQRGVASWYGKFHQGKKTASGEIFDMNKMTAAHRTLPFGSRLLVKRSATGQTVHVRINDRGPYSGGRILDLSFAAAEKIGIVAKGEDEVEIYGD